MESFAIMNRLNLLQSPTRLLSTHLSRRSLCATARSRAAPPFQPGPAPPRLPKHEQELYEQLQRSSTGAFSTPNPSVIVNQSPQSVDSGSQSSSALDAPAQSSDKSSSTESAVGNVNAKVSATGEGEELHPDVRRGAEPEFEGDRNPKTGEVGGPKNEPLRWGGEVDWSYNGRVTDF